MRILRILIIMVLVVGCSKKVTQVEVEDNKKSTFQIIYVDKGYINGKPINNLQKIKSDEILTLDSGQLLISHMSGFIWYYNKPMSIDLVKLDTSIFSFDIKEVDYGFLYKNEFDERYYTLMQAILQSDSSYISFTYPYGPPIFQPNKDICLEWNHLTGKPRYIVEITDWSGQITYERDTIETNQISFNPSNEFQTEALTVSVMPINSFKGSAINFRSGNDGIPLKCNAETTIDLLRVAMYAELVHDFDVAGEFYEKSLMSSNNPVIGMLFDNFLVRCSNYQECNFQPSFEPQQK